MKTPLNFPIKSLLRAGAAVAAITLATSSQAVIVGPYSPDANTLHLWHMDQTTVPVLNSVSGGTNLVGLFNGATLGNGSFTGFGNALNTLDGGQDASTVATTKDALLSPSTVNPPANIAATYADATTGAFTFEAIVWIGFDPAKNLGTTANGGNNRNTSLQIISAESTVNASRIFQFRIVPTGMVPIGTTPTTVPLLTFENVRAVVAAQPTIYAAIPTTGPDAIASNNWYHVAVSYNGIPNTANNIKLYWTLLDASRTSANQINITSAQTTLSGLNPLSSTSTPLVIGNEARARTANFLGMVDEVRISKVERSAVQMMFSPANVAIITPPASQMAALGETVTLSTVAGGGSPLSYQWLFNNANVLNGTNSSLVLPNITTNQAGNYKVVVSNPSSSATSSVAVVRVGQFFSELFNTGLSGGRNVLAGGTMDPHWSLVQSDDPAYPGPSAFVVTSLPGSWLAANTNSAWIAPGDGVSNAAGLYTYRTSFLLDTLDSANAELSGNWVSDNQGVDVRLNGVSLGFTNSTQLGSFTAFTITNGFVPGVNTLDLVVSNNVGGGINLTGVRAELRGVALSLPATLPQVVAMPANVVTQVQQSASFSVAAIGSGPLAYQWFHGATPLLAQTNRTLVLTDLTTAQNGNYTVVVTNSLGSTNVTATLTVVTPPALTWLGLSSGDWDTATINWLDTGSSANVAFSSFNDVLFDGSGSGAPTVNLTEALIPNSVMVDAANDYTFTSFSANGSIGGSASLTKRGSGTLILDTANTYSGKTKIQGGTLQVGNFNTSGTLGSGEVNNDASLVFTRADAFAVPNSITGTGSVTKAGTGGVILTGSNSYSGFTMINGGTVNLRRSAALGSTVGGTAVANGAQLFIDINVDVAAEPLELRGTGLAGDGALRKGGAGTTTFGGPITLAEYSGIKVDSNATLNLTNAAGISGADINLALATDAGGRGTVAGPVTLGAGTVTLYGPGTWVLAGTNSSWTGGTTITGGTLQIGDGGNNGSVGNGTIQNDATLTFLSSNNLIIASSIIGGGAVNQNGAGRVTLTGINSYSGITRINGIGTLRVGNDQALGSGTLQIGVAQTDTCRLELTGNQTISNPITIFPRAFGVLDNPADVVNVNGTNALNPPSPIVIPGGGNLLTLQSDNGLLVLSNGVSAGGVGRVLVLKGAAAGLIHGALTETNGSSQILYKLDSGTWTLLGANTYSGTTTISNGTLMVHGSLGTNVVTVAGGRLAGTGTIAGPVVVNAGGTVAPGASIGTLTVSNSLTLQAGSTASMEINKNAGTQDQVIGLTSVTYGGTLAVSNQAGVLAAGNSFKLFDAASYSGSFASIVPAIPGAGLAWNTSTLTTDGTLRVTSASTPATITSSSISGGNLIISGSGGAAGGAYVVLSSTNVAAPASTWIRVRTNFFDGSGNFSATNAVSPGVPANFFMLQSQ